MRTNPGRHPSLALLSLCVLAGPATGPAVGPVAAQVVPDLPRALEIELALSALPPHLRADASVYVLDREGYRRVSAGGNGFSCIVRRSGVVPGMFDESIIPICYDAVGSGTVMRAVFDEVGLLAGGTEPDRVSDELARRWDEGRYEVPGPGVSYMLSPVFYLHGRELDFPPHLMFYAPFKTDPDVGANDDPLDFVPFIQAPGLPSAVMVVPVGEIERAAIASAERDLVEAVRALVTTAMGGPDGR